MLVVEDNPGDAAVVIEAMGALDASVRIVVVETGYAAVDYLRRQYPYEKADRPDLVLVDLNLPGITGHRVLEIAKADARAKGIPVVVYSSDGKPETVKECLRCADDFIAKPTSWAQCLDAMRRVLHRLDQEPRTEAETAGTR